MTTANDRYSGIYKPESTTGIYRTKDNRKPKTHHFDDH